ncbi:Bcr/CflA family multidrug efflux MFS transporter [Streptomyces sp. NPDC005962]|uniref:Bcr/CflA family multidrug efflux MFS transporter n=1 Tax=Streptomyces sp. NPDC005962 TaxID=3154466 RepID=UPI0033EBB297
MDTAASSSPVSTEPAPTPPRPPRALRLLIVLGALSAFGPLSLDMYLPALPALARDFAVPDAGVQLTLTSCLIGLAVGQLIAGPLSDRWGRRVPLLIGLAGYLAASVLCAFAPNVTALTGLRAVQGIAGAAGIVISRAIVRDLYEGTAAARFFSLLMLVNGLAPILAPVIGGQLLRFTSWRGVFLVLAAIGAVLLAATVIVVGETLPPARRRRGGLGQTVRSFGTLLRDPDFLRPAFAGGFALAAMFAYISASSFVLQKTYGLDPQQFSVVFASNAAGIVLLGQGNARLLRRRSPSSLLRAGIALSAAGGGALLLSVLADFGVAAVLVSLFALVSSIGLIMPNSTALSMSGHPEMAGTASALLGLLQYALGGVAAPLTGLGANGAALPMALVIAACAAGAVVVHLWPVRRDAT